MTFTAGQRVLHRDDGWVGIVEEDGDPIFTDVRWLTPNNEPSCSISLCRTEALTAVPDTVINLPRSQKWWREARKFCLAIASVISSPEDK